MLRFTSSEYKKVATLVPVLTLINRQKQGIYCRLTRQTETKNPTLSTQHARGKTAEYQKKTSVIFQNES